MEWNKYRVVKRVAVHGTLFQPQFKKRFWISRWKDITFNFCGEYVNDVFNIRKQSSASKDEHIAKANIEVFINLLKTRPFKYKERVIKPILIKVPNGGCAGTIQCCKKPTSKFVHFEIETGADFQIILYEPATYVFISERSCYARTYTGLDNFKYTVDIEEHYEK